MKGLKVLITNHSLRERTGTEIYAIDLARGLLASGHTPMLYSPRPGALAERIRRETVPVIDDLDRLNIPPDIIHGQHADETVTALLRFPNAPAIYVCHDWYQSIDAPPRFSRVLRCVAVDSQCRDKLVFEHGVPEERVSVLLQSIDLKKFRPRAPLPSRPRRALILCNYTKENEYLEAARAACARAGVSLDVYGMGVGRSHERPEELLAEYDVVFAKARTALEALAVGASVVVYWWRRLGPVVTTAELERLRRDNFGMRAMGPRSTPEEFGRDIVVALGRYDADEAARVSERVRAQAGRERLVGEFVELYESVIAEHAAQPSRDDEAEARAAAAYLRSLSLIKSKEYDLLYDSATFRLRGRLLRMPLVGGIARALVRAAAGKRHATRQS
jgi:glycosyl transferase family 4